VIDETLSTSGWYAEEPITRFLREDKIDVLIVDGPNPTKDDLYSRYPVIPVLSSRLNSSCMMMLDDAGRRGERKVIEVWERLLNLEFIRIGKYAIGLRNSAFKPFL
jgi:hypothetical protein